MEYDQATDLRLLLEELFHQRAIRVREGRIQRTYLNPTASPPMRRHVPRLANLLYRELVAANVSYDAVVSIPTGGDQYADFLVDLVREREGRSVPRIRLRKRGKNSRFVVRNESVPTGARLLLVDDSIWTGSEARASAKVLHAAGYEVAGYLCAADIPYRFPRRIPARSSACSTALHWPRSACANSNRAGGSVSSLRRPVRSLGVGKALFWGAFRFLKRCQVTIWSRPEKPT